MYYIAAEEYGMKSIVFKYERFRQWSKPAFLKKILDKKLYNVYTKNNGGLLCRL